MRLNSASSCWSILNPLRRDVRRKYGSYSASGHETLFEPILMAPLRVRPIFMTAGSTVIGLLPIMLGTGTGSEVLRRLAAPMVGGMISAVLITLLVLPAIYYLWNKNMPRTATSSRHS